MSTTETPRRTFKAIIKSAGSKTLTKQNGAQYVLMNAEITEGPLKGKMVAATRTVVTKDAVVKEVPEIGTEVTLYHSYVESTREGEQFQHFFEISLSAESTSNNDLTALLGL